MQMPDLAASTDPVTEALSHFSGKSRERLLGLIKQTGFSGRIPALEAKSLAENERTSMDALMVNLLPLGKTYSRPPISNYRVGTVARGESGDLYLGANLEFPGHSLGFSVHGEQSALSNAYMHGDRGVTAIAVTAAPCGHCRQFMNELSPEVEVLVGSGPSVKLSSLLPFAFGPKDLGVTDLAFPVKELNLLAATPDDLTKAALDAARKSYAPYTKAYSGVAIGTRSGRIFKGSYIENAAYNPSLPPLQTALAALILGGESYSAISEVVLLEKEDAPISQRSVAEAVLSAVAAGLKLKVMAAKIKA
jgi:cytidine deaminase